MGGAMLARMSADIPSDEFIVYDPSFDCSLFDSSNINGFSDAKEFKDKIRQAFSSNDNSLITVIIAVKPQIAETVCRDFYSLTENLGNPCDILVISVVAGLSTLKLQGFFNDQYPVIRLMPNTPVLAGKGAIVACPDKQALKIENITKTLRLMFSSSGSLYFIEDESLMDSVTALSGSGPAYVFLLCEIMAQIGESLGLDCELSSKLARQTIIGSAYLLEKEQEIPASTLRENVTSPNGTTAAAMEILMNGELQEIFEKAMQNAKQRSIELGTTE